MLIEAHSVTKDIELLVLRLTLSANAISQPLRPPGYPSRAIGVPCVTVAPPRPAGHDAGLRCRDLRRHLVDLHLGEQLVGLHRLAVRDEPGRDDALGVRRLLRQRGEQRRRSCA